MLRFSGASFAPPIVGMTRSTRLGVAISGLTRERNSFYMRVLQPVVLHAKLLWRYCGVCPLIVRLLFVLIPLDIHVEWDHSTSHSTFSFDGRRLLRPQDPCKALWKQSGSAALAYTPLRRTHSLTSYVLGSLRTAAPSSCWGLHLDSLSAPTASSLCGVNDETLSSYAPWACHAYATISPHRLHVARVDM